MRHFIANIIAMFFISRKLRHRIRNKIMNSKNIYQRQYLQLKTKWLENNHGDLLLPGRFRKYDLVFGIGATCIAPEMLNYFKLRTFSNPFDWTAGMEPENWLSQPNIYRDTRFREKIQAICNNFKDWTNPKYFKYVSTFHMPQDPHHHIVNTKTHIRYLHEFPADQDIAQHFPEFINKTSRRIQNLYNALDSSQNILIVWIASTGDQRAVLEKPVSDKDIKWAVAKMHNMYPTKNFDFVFFEPDGNKNRFEYDKIEIAPGAFRIKSNHFLLDSEYNFITRDSERRPHIHIISEMLDNIQLSEQSFKLSDNHID